MLLSNLVHNIDIAIKLKELGVTQDSYFYWYTDGTNEIVNEKTDYIQGVYGYGGKNDAKYSAFSVVELGEMLPNKFHTYKNDLAGILWVCKAENSQSLVEVTGLSEADAKGKMLILLIETWGSSHFEFCV